jgi:type IV secretory pathway VirB10-like protein
VDFKPVNGKYEVSILRNKHSHTKEVRKGNSKEDQDKNKEMVPMRPKNTAQNTFQNANQFVAVSSVKTEMREAGSSLKDFLDKMRTTAPTNSTIQRMPSKEIQPTPINRPDVASSFMNPQPTRVTINKFKAL